MTLRPTTLAAVTAVTVLLPLGLALENSTLAQPTGKVEIGILNCKVAGGAGFVVASSKKLECVLERPSGPERYYGAITKFGVDIGGTFEGVIAWAVLAPSADMPKGALAGTYAGVTGEATVGYGVSANALVGGSGNTIALQPLSVGAQKGLNVAAGIAALELNPRPD